MVKNPSVMKETWFWSLGREDPWRRKWQNIPPFLPGETHGQTAWWAIVYGVAKVRHDLATKPLPYIFCFLGMFISSYLILFDVMVNGIVSLISLSDLLLLVYRICKRFLCINFVSCNFTKFIDNLR